MNNTHTAPQVALSPLTRRLHQSIDVDLPTIFRRAIDIEVSADNYQSISITHPKILCGYHGLPSYLEIDDSRPVFHIFREYFDEILMVRLASWRLLNVVDETNLS